MLLSRKVPRFFALLFFACATALLYTQSAHAISVDAEYVDAATIKLNSLTFSQSDRDNGNIHEDFDDLSIAQINTYVSQQVVGNFKDRDIGDNTKQWLRDNDGCDSKIEVGNTTELKNVMINVSGIGCKDVIGGIDKPLSQSELDNPTLPTGGNKAQIWFRWIAENALVRVDGWGGNFVADGVQTERYFSADHDNHYVGISDSSPARGTYHEGGDLISVNIADVQKRSEPPLDPDASLDAGDEKTCEDNGGDLGWILCPVLAFIDDQLTSLDNTIQNLLEVPPGDFADGSPMHKAWGVIRTISYSILLPIILVMVISTALGFDFVSAYTIKKALPRFIIATLFIALSWEIVTFMIEFTNNVGKGVQGLIETPFQDVIATSLADILGAASLTLFFAAAGTAAAAFVIVGPALLGILLSYGFVALLALLIGFLVLTLRQLILLTLLLLAPLAILAWIFPGNDKAWKTWWGSFTKLLIMYPLIMLLISMGRVFSGITVSTRDGDIFTYLIALVAYIGPYFFIPSTFKLAGGLFATIAGATNDRSRGLFDRNRKFRQEKSAQASMDRKAGQLWKGNNAVTNRMNRMGHGAAGGLAGGFGLGRRGRAYKDESTAVSSDDMMRTPEWKGAMFKDNAMRALTHTNEASARADLMSRGVQGEDLEQALLSARRVGYGRTSQVAAAKQLAMNKTGYNDAADAMDVIQRVSGGNGVMATSLKENIKYTSKGVGRNDLGALRTMDNNELELARTDQTAARQAWNDSMTVKGAETADAATLARNHAMSVGNISSATKRVMNRAHGGSVDGPAARPDDVAAAGKVVGAMKDAESYATLGNTDKIDTAAAIADRQQAVQGGGPYRPQGTPDGDESLLQQNLRRRGVGDPNDPNAPQGQGLDIDHDD